MPRRRIYDDETRRLRIKEQRRRANDKFKMKERMIREALELEIAESQATNRQLIKNFEKTLKSYQKMRLTLLDSFCFIQVLKIEHLRLTYELFTLFETNTNQIETTLCMKIRSILSNGELDYFNSSEMRGKDFTTQLKLLTATIGQLKGPLCSKTK